MPSSAVNACSDEGETCGQCKHWRQTFDNPDLGECYYLPPIVKMDDDEGTYELIRPPLEKGEMACGKFKGSN